ncbi:uncharacterized protein LOC134268936 [Saccostrea cucullata]|uniref:uncharacterized protein LOC134268936 n=1 Tax=Saccostrea cuccullata TaxID=36930 RepID=UPI002ED0DBC1
MGSLMNSFPTIVMSLIYVPLTHQTDSICMLQSPYAKHYATLNLCYWVTSSSDTADNGALACNVSGGFMAYMEAGSTFLTFISDSMDNHWSPGTDVFVGLRSWTENNQFTQWDGVPIYTFNWDYTNGQPDGIAQLEFCVVLSVTSPHPWHNRKCGSTYPSLCYCELGSLEHPCVPPGSSVTSTTLSSSLSTSATPSTQVTIVSSFTSTAPTTSINSMSTSLISLSSFCPTVTSTLAVTSTLTVTSTMLMTIYLSSSITTPSASGSCLCTALSNSSSNITNEDIAKLKIDKTTTSRYLRKKYSAGDTRPLSQFMGSSAVIIIVVYIGAIVIWDLLVIAQQVKTKFHKCMKGLQQKSAKIEHGMGLE